MGDITDSYKGHFMATGEDWRRAHESARRLHEALAQVGVTETELATLSARESPAGQPMVVIPPLRPASVALLLGALRPALGPTPAERA